MGRLVPDCALILPSAVAVRASVAVVMNVEPRVLGVLASQQQVGDHTNI